jgi:hypothetical protein
MIRGVLTSLAFYTIGLFLSWVSYIMAGNHGYAHAPSLYHIIIFLTFLIGALWMLIAVFLYFNRKSERLKGIIITNLVMSSAFAVLITGFVKQTEANNTYPENKLKVEVTGDTTIIRHDGSIVYIKVKDSVVVNFIDSSKVDLKKMDSLVR